MESQRFDRLTRRLARRASRRSALGGLGAVLAALATGPRADLARATPFSVPLGGACYRDKQCINDYVAPRGAGLNPDLQIVYCAENGFWYDGELNCCRFEGGFCRRDEECCGFRSCIDSFCSFPEPYYG